MKLMQHKVRLGNLSLDKYGRESDHERAVLPAIVWAHQKFHKDHIIILGIGWWKWGIRLTTHWNMKGKYDPSR